IGRGIRGEQEGNRRGTGEELKYSGFDFAQPPGFDFAQPPGFDFAQPPGRCLSGVEGKEAEKFQEQVIDQYL
ncbi:MAG: hypothetical protein LWX70_14520, partial [Sphingobacteriia bacterium]|nr:hypothetical protein [Sphingobacteriia bacterium]